MNISYTSPLGLQFNHITVTSKWAWWHLISPASRLLTQPFFRCRSKKTSNSASLAFLAAIHRIPVNSLHKGPITRKMFPLDDVIMRIDYRWYKSSAIYVSKFCHYRPHNTKRTRKYLHRVIQSMCLLATYILRDAICIALKYFSSNLFPTYVAHITTHLKVITGRIFKQNIMDHSLYSKKKC